VTLLDRLLHVSLLTGALFAWPVVAAAQAQRSDPRSDAKALYGQGADAYKAGRYGRAIELFLAADALSPSAPLSFNVARAYEKLGDPAKALRYYRDYVRRAAPSPQVTEARTTIAALEAGLMRRGLQQVTVRSEPNADVSIDGRALGSTPWTGELAPGEHRLVLTRPGFVASERTFELPAARALDLDLRLEPSPGEPPMTPASRADEAVVPARSPHHEPAKDSGATTGFGPWPWVTLAAGGATLAAAGFVELSRQSAEDEARRSGDQLAYADALESMEARQTAARVLLGVGAGLVAVGTTLVVIDLGRDRDERRVAVSCSPVACFGRLEVSLR
jgi:tetratricopeptide (TPR) repeat protein